MTRKDPSARYETWDPFGTLHNALWIGGGQWAGKSTIARILALRYGLTAYHYDYHDARGHNDRRVARRVRLGEPVAGPGPDKTWVHTTPRNMTAQTLASFPVRFEWVLDDLRALVSGRPIIHDVSDPTRAQDNRLTRDHLVAQDAIRSAHRLGIRVIEVDGSRTASAVASIVADHFSPYLPAPDSHEA